MPRMTYRPDIDGLRAVAVLSVVLSHAGLGLPGGYVGVDVFFVISGYLITSLILKEMADGRFSLLAFWERRVRRIAPALVVVVVATLALGWFLLMPDAYLALGKSVIALALLVSNVHFWRDTGYFAPVAGEKPLLHTWSLAAEEQFYLLVPALLFFGTRRLGPRRLLVALAGATVSSFALAIYGSYRYPGATFYLLPTRAWELFVGSLLALSFDGGAERSPRSREGMAALGLALIVVPCAFYDQETRFPGLAALPPVLGTAFVIWAGHPSAGGSMTNRLLAWRPIVFVGLISYSLYLWHWPLFAFARNWCIEPLAVGERLGLVAASLTLGALSWQYVERPFRSRRFFASRRGAFTAAAVSSAVLIASGGLLVYTDGADARLPEWTSLLATTSRRDPSWIRELDVEDIPANLWRLGAPDAAPGLLVWGDSQAMAILPAIDSLCREKGVAAVAATHSATVPLVDYYNPSRYGLNEGAIPYNAAVMRYVQTERIRTVLLAGGWANVLGNAGARAALLETVRRLEEAGANVYLLKTVPAFPFDIAKAVVLGSFQKKDISRLVITEAEYEAASGFTPSLLRELRDRRFHLLDPAPTLRSRTGTTDIVPYDSGGSFYRNGGHLSTYGALALRPLFVPMVESLR